MKKLIMSLAVVVALLVSVDSNAKNVTVTKTNGGTGGYNDVKEKHQTGMFVNKHSLTCSEPGNIQCKWTTEPLIVPAGEDEPSIPASDFETLALNSITEDGDLSGTSTHFGVTYSWIGTDEYNYEVVVNDSEDE